MTIRHEVFAACLPERVWERLSDIEARQLTTTLEAVFASLARPAEAGEPALYQVGRA